MSYDLRVCVKVEGCEKYADIAKPEYDSPTYNLSKMFRACTGWNYVQGIHYPCILYLPKIVRGIRELKNNREAYIGYNPLNGWGTIDDAIEALEGWRDCILKTSEEQEIPIECLYVSW